MLDLDCTYSRIAHKADCIQECHLFISTKHLHLPPFVKPHNILNLPKCILCTIVCGILLNVQSGVDHKKCWFQDHGEQPLTSVTRWLHYLFNICPFLQLGKVETQFWGLVCPAALLIPGKNKRQEVLTFERWHQQNNNGSLSTKEISTSSVPGTD